MRKILVVLVGAIILSFWSEAGFSQIRSKKMRRKNNKIANYRGHKSWFSKEKRYSYLGVSVSAFNYFGDLAPFSGWASTDISFTRPGIGIIFGHRFGPRYTLTASFSYGTVRGDDFESADPTDEDAKFRYVRNLHFRNRIKELTVTAVFDLFKNEATYINRVLWTPYLYIGVAGFHHNPQAFVPEESGLEEAGTWVNLQPLGTEGQYADLERGDANAGIKPYSNFQFAIPFGVGIRYKLNQVLDLSFETGVRFLFTDYLDDVSQSYVDPGVFGDNALARLMADLSREATAPVSGQARDINNPAIKEIMDRTMTISGRDGNSYSRIAGYGQEGLGNIRGNKNENDLYFVTTIKVSYILGASFGKVKFR